MAILDIITGADAEDYRDFRGHEAEAYKREHVPVIGALSIDADESDALAVVDPQEGQIGMDFEGAEEHQIMADLKVEQDRLALAGIIWPHVSANEVSDTTMIQIGYDI